MRRFNDRDAASFTVPASEYDIVICGAGSAGSVLARRLSETPHLRVLLIEAGGSDLVPCVQDAGRWPENLGSATDWAFVAERAAHLNGRGISLPMGKVLGGGSGIDAMIWARGHQADWDHFADEAGDDAWGYASVLDIYRRIEDWRGKPDGRHGVDGPVMVTRPSRPHPVAHAMVRAAASLGIPLFDSPNGEMMERHGGCALADIRAAGDKRLSIFGSYVRPVLDRPNLTVLTGAPVDRVVFSAKRAIAVDVIHGGARLRIAAREQVILSTGAINTPVILMRSGVGDETDLAELGIPLVRHLPGVGRNLQDHTCFGSVWEYLKVLPAQGNGSEATLYARSHDGLESPDILMCQVQFPVSTPEAGAADLLPHGWTMLAGLAKPKSRGSIHLRSVAPTVPPRIELNVLSHPDDWKVARAAVAMSREIGRADAFAHINRRESLPGNVFGMGIDNFIRNSAMSFFDLSGTAKMGRDDMSVVDATLRVHGLENLTVADGSIMPRITTGNTLAPCVVIGERASDILKASLGI